MKKYDPKAIEAKWRKIWAETGLYRAVDGDPRPKYYFLTEFPYPSGDGIHMGHTREYTAGDVAARYQRMQGHNVLYPMGWDAFGLPTENYAIRTKITPQRATADNVATFRRQMQSLGLSFDWEREVCTSDPAYYRWTQWIFLQLFRAGLAYQAELPIWWCPLEKTGLANEEVVDGKHERCGTPVERKLLKQWLLKITAYADRLIDDLATVDYSERIAAQQINWIGRSHGALVKFPVVDSDQLVEVFTTRIDTIFGATYLVLAPEHPLVAHITTKQHQAAVLAYVQQTRNKTELERQEDDKAKTGVFTGAYATNPSNNERLPIWIADYVLAGYGTGAIMAVPAHDERDHDFAEKFDLPTKNVIDPVLARDDAKGMTEFKPKHKIVAVVQNAQGQILTINWGPKLGGRLTIGGTIEGDESPEATALREVEEETGYHNLQVVAVGQETMHYKYYAFSKHEAHDATVKFVYLKLTDESQKAQNLDDSEQGNFTVEWVGPALAEAEIVELLHRYGYDKFIHGRIYSGSGVLANSGQFDGLPSAEARPQITAWLAKKGLAEAKTTYHLRDWIFSRQHYWGDPIPIIHCPKDGVVPVPEDQLPVELPPVESYEPTGTGESPLAAMADWVNVTCPTCGGPARRETDTMPNWAGSSWYYLRYTDPHNDRALASAAALEYWLPVDTYLGGMEHTTLHLLYSRFWHKFLYDQGVVPTPEPYARRRAQGIVLAGDGHKMSKSLGNVVNPTDVIARHGADSLRLHILFMAPLEDTTSWSDARLAGTARFLYRVWALVQEYLEAAKSAAPGDTILAAQLTSQTHKLVQKVTTEIADLNLNTPIAALMEHVNELYRLKVELPLGDPAWRPAVQTLLLLLAPLAPHITEELWQELGETESIHVQPWPKYDPALIRDEVMTIVVQVGGKVRATIALPTDQSEEQVIEAARQAVAAQLQGQTIAKTISVPHRLVNFVLG